MPTTWRAIHNAHAGTHDVELRIGPECHHLQTQPIGMHKIVRIHPGYIGSIRKFHHLVKTVNQPSVCIVGNQKNTVVINQVANCIA